MWVGSPGDDVEIEWAVVLGIHDPGVPRLTSATVPRTIDEVLWELDL
ncbi:MAG: hypothetical protein ACRDQ2_01970 [Gaiellales bacterium]